MKNRLGRSTGGNILIYGVLSLFGLFMLLPLVYVVSSAFKPLDELFVFPPRFFVKNPTLDNFADLLTIMGEVTAAADVTVPNGFVMVSATKSA